jgi:hypothetical protein
MGETVLWQRIGGESTLKGQLRHLLSLIDDRSEHLRIRIHPFDRSTGGALAGTPSLVFMDFEGADLPTVAFVEALVSLLLVEKPIEVDQLTVFYEQAFESALDEAETRALIASRL